MFIVLKPAKKVGILIPTCGDCRVDLVLTTFEDGVTRWLCPKCKREQYTKGMTVIHGYGVGIGEENERD